MVRVVQGVGVEELPRRRCIQLAGVASSQSLVRALIVVTLDEGVEALLLLQEVVARRLGGFLLELPGCAEGEAARLELLFTTDEDRLQLS